MSHVDGVGGGAQQGNGRSDPGHRARYTDQSAGLAVAQERPEVLAFALHVASKRSAELQGPGGNQQPSPSTPSGMVPVYAKASVPRRRKKPGPRPGHPGHRRRGAPRVDKQETHRLKRCPCPTGQAGGRGTPRRRHPALDEAPWQVRRVHLYVSGLRGCGLLEQLRGAADSSGGDPAEESRRVGIEPLGRRRGHASCTDERLPHTRTPRHQPDRGHRRRTENPGCHRPTPAATRHGHCRRMKSYGSPNAAGDGPSSAGGGVRG